MRPAAQAAQGGSIPRATQLSTGTTTTRVPSSSSPTTSWPGVNGNDTIGSNHRELVPSMVARSEPQMPARRGRTRTQPGPGRSGGSTSRRASGPTFAPAPGESLPATIAAANLAGLRENRSAFIGFLGEPKVRLGAPCARRRLALKGWLLRGRRSRPSAGGGRRQEPLPPPPPPARTAAGRLSTFDPPGCDLAYAAASGAAPLGADGQEGAVGAGGLAEVLDQPPALAGQGGESGLGVDRHREADGDRKSK